MLPLNNNPFNLRYVKSNHWLGKVKPPEKWSSFEAFDNIEHGVRAGLINLLTQMRKSSSLRDLMYRYAPPCENDTESYIMYVNNRIVRHGFDSVKFFDMALHSSHYFYYLASAISYYESHYILSYVDFSMIIDHYHIFEKHEKILLNNNKNTH